MKKCYYYAIILSFMVSACGLDNYDEPESLLKGRITYEGKNLGLKGSANGGGGIELQLYQDDYANHDPITVYASQEGTFSAVLFDGFYKLVTKDKNGPWVNSRDTLYIEVKGPTECELKVTPYFTISDENITLQNNQIVGTCDVKKIVESAEINQAMLLLSKTSFVDESTNIARINQSNIEPGDLKIIMDILEVIVG